MLLLLSILSFFLADTTTGYLLPTPPGKYNVTLATGPLVDHNRNDRALMLSVFQPAKCAHTVPVPYMPNQTAEYQGEFLQKHFDFTANLAPLFLEARLPVCPDDPNHCATEDDGPILFFSPGWDIPRLYYSVIASAIASEGFTVITIDHPDDSSIITYPDGHSVYSNGPEDPSVEYFTHYMYARVADASFIIDQLSNATAIAKLLPQRGPRAFPTDRIAMAGHSLGGSASVILAGQDPRVRAAINWDGATFGSLPHSGISKPVFLVSEPTNLTNETWEAMWPQLKGPKLWVSVANATHQSLSDALSLFQAAGQDVSPFADFLGTIAPAQMIRIFAEYTAAWLDGAFKGKVGGPLLEGKESGRFPEVSVVKKGNF